MIPVFNVFLSSLRANRLSLLMVASLFLLAACNPETKSYDMSISSVSPINGVLDGGYTLTINGSGFSFIESVTVGGNTCTNVSIVSANQLTCTTPASATGGAKQVIVRGQARRTASWSFTYIDTPVLHSVSPGYVKLSGGTTINIIGTSFTSNMTVTIGGLPCTSIVVQSSTLIQCATPALTAGIYDIEVSNNIGNTDSLPSSVTYSNFPTISSIVPATGPNVGNTTITINGTGFIEGALVRLGTLFCSNVTVLSDTQITCVTPSTADNGPISIVVTNQDTQSVTVTNGYTYSPASLILGVSPSSSALAFNTNIFIFGLGFDNGAIMTVGGKPCTSFDFNNSGSHDCLTPMFAARTYNAAVTNSSDFSYTLANAYTYRAAPTVTAISPTGGALGGSTSVVITGTNFVATSTVSIGGITCSSPVVTATTITCATGPHVPGTYNVVVDNNDSQTFSFASAYTYRPAPTVSGVSSATSGLVGAGTITINGTGFIPGATVDIGGTGCTSVIVTSAVSLTCVPQAKTAGTYTITVSNPDNQSGVLVGAFTYQPAPVVSSVYPASGALAGGSIITIKGLNFAASAAVNLGGSPCTVGALTSTSITCTTTARTAGIVNVQVTNTDSQSGTLSDGFTYQGAPTVTTVYPNSGKQAGGTVIIITGTGFMNGATVNIGVSACTGVSFVSSTQLTCTTPSGAAGAVAASVINPDAQSGSLVGGFTYTAVALIEFQVGAVSPNPPNPDTYGPTTTNITHTFTVKNTGEAVSTELSVFLSGVSPAAYSLGTDTCNGNTLAAGAACTIQLTFLGGFMGTGTYNAVLNTTATSGGTTTNVVTGSVP